MLSNTHYTYILCIQTWLNQFTKLIEMVARAERVHFGRNSGWYGGHAECTWYELQVQK